MQSGTCRDFATLMIEAIRHPGYAAAISPGATHVWLQVYLPEAGWISFDPTNNLVGGTDLIRVGVARHASLASPVICSWTGAPGDYLGMEVNVQVRRRVP